MLLPVTVARDYFPGMAWRIHDSVVRGEIDNRVKGMVRGTLWLDGLAEPVTLELAGNACPDLAGCLLQFTNPTKTYPMRKKPAFAPVQRGRIGDLSASRKVRVFTVPEDVAFAMIDRGEKPPERMANALYLEWFSDGNGRVVIESAEFQLTISAPEWRLTAAEEQQRAQAAEAGWEGFTQQLDAAVEKQKRGQKDPEAEWDEHDYEKFLKESDARTDKYMELLEKYGDSDEAEEKSHGRWAGRRSLRRRKRRSSGCASRRSTVHARRRWTSRTRSRSRIARASTGCGTSTGISIIRCNFAARRA